MRGARRVKLTLCRWDKKKITTRPYDVAGAGGLYGVFCRGGGQDLKLRHCHLYLYGRYLPRAYDM